MLTIEDLKGMLEAVPRRPSDLSSPRWGLEWGPFSFDVWLSQSLFVGVVTVRGTPIRHQVISSNKEEVLRGLLNFVVGLEVQALLRLVDFLQQSPRVVRVSSALERISNGVEIEG